MIDLWYLRRLLLPIAERLDKSFLSNEYKFAFSVQEKEYVGTIDKPIRTVRPIVKGLDSVYPNNLAAAKYVETDDGRVYDAGSYAHRVSGLFGDFQTHIRLFPIGERTTAVYAHHEYNPLAHPRKHYNGVDWNAKTGVSRAKQLLRDHIEK